MIFNIPEEVIWEMSMNEGPVEDEFDMVFTQRVQLGDFPKMKPLIVCPRCGFKAPAGVHDCS